MSINATQNMQKNILNDTEVLSDEREIMFPIQNYAIFTGYNSSSEKLKSAFKKNEEGTAR